MRAGAALGRAAAAGALLALAACGEAPDPEVVARGAQVFEGQCAGCHRLDENAVGPKLAGVLDRPAGAVEGYDYSEALAAHGGDWDEGALVAYLMDPSAVVPGGRMVIAPLSEGEARDVVAYLAAEG